MNLHRSSPCRGAVFSRKYTRTKMDIFWKCCQHWHLVPQEDFAISLSLIGQVDMRGAIPSWVWGSGVPKMAVPMSTAHIYSGLHPLRASSTPYSHNVTSVPQEHSWAILSSLWDPRPCPAQQGKTEDWLMEGHLAISRTSSKKDHQELYSFPGSLPTHLPSKNSVSQALQRNSLWLFL